MCSGTPRRGRRGGRPQPGAASYAIGGAEQASGGDWFDVLALGDDTVAAVVGDVVGHGVYASAVMAQLRAVAARADLSQCEPNLTTTAS